MLVVFMSEKYHKFKFINELFLDPGLMTKSYVDQKIAE